MARPYSIDLRERVVAQVMAGDTVRCVAARFGVSVSSVVKWAGRFRETGSAAPGQMGGHKPVLLAAHRDFVRSRFAEQPELTLRGLQYELAARDVKVSYGAVWAFVHAEKLSFKKNFAGGRARAARCSQAPRPMAKISGSG